MVIWMGIYFHCQKLDEIRWIIERDRQEQWDFIYFLLQGASADGVPATPTVPHLRLWVWYPPTQLLEGEKEDFPVAALYDGKVLWTLPNFFLQRNHGNSKCNPLKDGWIMYCYGINSCSVLLHLRQRNSGPMQGLRRRTQTAPMQSKPVASGKRRTQEFWCWLARICRKKAWLHTLRTTPRRASGVFDPSGPWQDKPFGHIWARCTKFIQIPTQKSLCLHRPNPASQIPNNRPQNEPIPYKSTTQPGQIHVRKGFVRTAFMDAQWGLLWVTAVTAHTSYCGLKDFFCMTCLESWRWWASKATWFRVDPFIYLPIPSYTILYHPMPIIAYLSSYLHTIPCVYPSFAVYGYVHLPISKKCIPGNWAEAENYAKTHWKPSLGATANPRHGTAPIAASF